MFLMKKVLDVCFVTFLLTDNIVTSIVKDLMERLDNESVGSPGTLEMKSCTGDDQRDDMTKVIDEYKSVFSAQKIR